MNKQIALVAVVLSILPLSSFAASPKHAAKSAPLYVCQKCHMKYSAAAAKKDHYKDPMDGGKLVPIKAATGNKSKPMGGMKM